MTGPKIAFVDWLSERLARAGLRHAFGVPGGGTSLDLLAALKGYGVETVVSAREDAAVIMAGVSGILADGPGLAFTTKGPGLANAANGLAQAALDRMPALLVSEGFDQAELDYVSHQVFSQSDLVAPLVGSGDGAQLPARPDAVEGWLAGDGDRPAVMFPSATDLRRPVAAAVTAPPKPATDAPNIGPALALIGRSRRPVVVIGLQAARAAVTPALRQFVDRLGAPVLCTYMAKGCVGDDDPHFAGIFTGGAIEQPCVGAADLIILIGLDPVELIRKPWPYAAPVLDLCERVRAPHYVVPAGRVVAPLGATLGALGQNLKARDWRPPDIAAMRGDYFAGMAQGGEGPLSSAGVVKATVDAFAAGPRLSVDAGAHMFSACAFWPAKAPRDVLISNGLATMAFALPAAIAAALSDRTRGAIAMTGDGGLLMCLGELKTAAVTNANVTVVVFNDGRLSLIDIKRQDRQMPDLGLSWPPADFAAIARGFGLKAWRVERGGDLAPALAAAARETGPRLVDVCIDASGYGEQIRALRG